MQAWYQMRVYGDAPFPGTRVRVSPELIISDDDGGECGACALDQAEVTGTITRVGGHWSDQPHGRSGWYVLLAIDDELTLEGRPLRPSDRVQAV